MVDFSKYSDKNSTRNDKKTPFGKPIKDKDAKPQEDNIKETTNLLDKVKQKLTKGGTAIDTHNASKAAPTKAKSNLQFRSKSSQSSKKNYAAAPSRQVKVTTDLKICPNCESSNTKKLTAEAIIGPRNYKYLCLSCETRFNDESEPTLIREKIPPIQTWLQVWYYLNCTSSNSYIAAKLGLSIDLVNKMVKILRRVFNQEKPENTMQNFDDWAKEHANFYEQQIKEQIIAKQDLFASGESVITPKDTAEYRRQAQRRRGTDK